MAVYRIDPGRLRHRLLLEAPVEQADGQGGVFPGFRTFATVWAAIEPMGPVETDDTGFAALSRQVRIILRFRRDIRIGQRFSKGQRLFVIEDASDPDEGGRFLHCICREDPS